MQIKFKIMRINKLNKKHSRYLLKIHDIREHSLL